MFKTLVPVLGALLLAGPVLAADAPASQGQSATAPAKTHHKKHHAKKHSKASSAATQSGAPK